VLQLLLTLPLALALALQSGSCRTKTMNDNTPTRGPQAATPNSTPDRPRGERDKAGGTSDKSANNAADGGRLAEGLWGGPHVRLQVSEAGAEIEFDCAHGTLKGPLTLTGGRFDVAGTFMREGGPQRAGDERKGLPARYRGQVAGPRLTLTLVLADEDADTFTLTHGEEPRLTKCK
jgi:hypothetical protein